MPMLRYPLAVAAALSCAVPALAADAQIPAGVTAAVNDAGRPAAQRQEDAVRMPAAMVAFSTMSKVYAAVPAENLARRPQAADAVKALAAEPGFGNIAVINPPVANISAPEPVDIVWTSNNYHDLKNNNTDTAAMNRSIFNALKPGGVYFVIDHKGAPGSGLTQTNTLHRIDPEALKAEIMRAGFVLDGESNALNRPADNMTTHSSFESSQIVFRFRKPR
jgi:predicted methyltransferase